MATGKLLIADDNEDFLLAMTEALQQRYGVVQCRDGKTALELLRREQFGLLILNLSLPELDGIGLLEAAHQEQICPPVLALTPLLSEYIIQSAQRMEVGYLVRIPGNIQSLTIRAAELFQLPEPDARAFLSDLLLQLGLKGNHKGYDYLVECILRYARNPDQAYTKELYPGVGKLFRHNGSQVERSIRTALKTAWNHRDAAFWQQYFPCDSSCPSASLFISRLAKELTQLRE